MHGGSIVRSLTAALLMSVALLHIALGAARGQAAAP